MKIVIGRALKMIDGGMMSFHFEVKSVKDAIGVSRVIEYYRETDSVVESRDSKSKNSGTGV